jgi:hypothetical protein
LKFKFLIALFAIVLSACAPEEATPTPSPRPTASRPAPAATPAPTATTQVAASSTASSPFVVYDDKSAPFTIQYPRGWTIREEPESIFFTAPDESAMLHIITYEYQEGVPKNIAAKDVLNNFSQNFTQGTGLKLTQPVTNADSSISANVEYTNASAPAQQGLLRVALAKSRRYHFIVLFSANRDQFAHYKPIGTTVVESFRER